MLKILKSFHLQRYSGVKAPALNGLKAIFFNILRHHRPNKSLKKNHQLECIEFSLSTLKHLRWSAESLA